jgi:hypothetical protein
MKQPRTPNVVRIVADHTETRIFRKRLNIVEDRERSRI